MLNNKNNSPRPATHYEVEEIISTLEGIIRQGGTHALAEWTKWKTVLCMMEGR